MGKRRGPWDDGHRAWMRLAAWHGGGRAGSSGATGDAGVAGDAALDAMADIGTLRRLLDQAELAAVRTARRQRRSWAEIATQLGITRQSAWERWRELDDDAATSGAAESLGAAEPPGEDIATDVSRDVLGDVTADLVAELTSREAPAQRRRAKVVVPDVVGMRWDDARHALVQAGLQATGPDPDGPPPLASLGWPNVVVVDQVPEAGAKVQVGSQVRLWLERGDGSAGVREPRRPAPTPKGGFEWRDEPVSSPRERSSDESVG